MINTIWMRIHSISDNVASGTDVLSGRPAHIKLPEVGATGSQALKHEHSLLKDASGSLAFGAEVVFRLDGAASITENSIQGSAEHTLVLSQPIASQSDSKQTDVLEGGMRTLLFGRSKEGKNRFLSTEADIREAAEATVNGRGLERSPLLPVFRQYGLNSAIHLKADETYFDSIKEMLEKKGKDVHTHGVDGIGFGVALRAIDMSKKEIVGYREINGTHAQNANAGIDLFEKHRQEVAAFYHAAKRNGFIIEALPTQSIAMGNESCISYARRLLSNEVLLQQTAKLISQDNKTPLDKDGKPLLPGDAYFPNIAGQALQVQIRERQNSTAAYAFATGNSHIFTQVFSIAKAPTGVTNPRATEKLHPRRRAILLESQAQRVKEAHTQPTAQPAAAQAPQTTRNTVVVNFPTKHEASPSPSTNQSVQTMRAADSFLEPIAQDAVTNSSSEYTSDHSKLKQRDVPSSHSMTRVNERVSRLLELAKQNREQVNPSNEVDNNRNPS